MTETAERLVDLARQARPKLRGWLHTGAFPVALVSGIVLICLAPTEPAMTAAAIYAVASCLLFGVSAAYHRGHWSARTQAILQRLDYSNIYLIIAGTYTPFALLALHGGARTGVLSVVWIGAAIGLVFRVSWPSAPRWLSTPLYIALGWVAIFVTPELIHGAGVAPTVLVLVGGLFYTVGGVIYALRRPDPAPRWFGFHEVFHSLTIIGWITQYIAVSFVTYRAV